MSQLPDRSVRLRSFATTDLDRLTGERGEVFYDRELRTLKIYNGAGVAASTVNISAAPTPPAQLVNGQQTATLGTTGNLTLTGDLVLAVNKDVKNSSGQGIFALLTNYVTGASLGSTLNSYVLQNTGATGNIFTNLIDSADSSAITVTPAVIFSSDVVVENELTINTGIIKNAEATWQLNGISLELPEYGLINSKTAVTIQAYDVDQSGGAVNGSGSGFYAEIFAMVYAYDDVIIRANNNNGVNKDWDFLSDGRLVFPVAAVPARSFGAVGDRRGMLAIDDSYIYYCTANYVNNSTNIWKRTAHGAGTW
jgi:hypothetical protein